MSYVKTPVILDKKLLDDGLHALFTDFAADLSTEFSLPPMSDAEVQALCTSVTIYLKHFVGDGRRRSKQPLRPKDLELHILRTRNPTEEHKIIDSDGKTKYEKGEKKWYRLVLVEITTTTITSTTTSGKEKARKKTEEKIDVQTLAEGSLRLHKSSVLTGFQDAVEKKVEKRENEEKERTKKLKKEADKRRAMGTRKKPGPPKRRVEKRTVRKKRKAEGEESGDEDDESGFEVGLRDHVGEEKAVDEEEEDDGGWGLDLDDGFDSMMYKAKTRSESKPKGTRKSALARSDGSNDKQAAVKKRKRPSQEGVADVHEYNGDSGEFDGIRVKKKKKKSERGREKVHFDDVEGENNAI